MLRSKACSSISRELFKVAIAYSEKSCYAPQSAAAVNSRLMFLSAVGHASEMRSQYQKHCREGTLRCS
ncbi:MAG TPA: hypothetical protein V6D37_10035 [Candidatus Sericytochromatia bacterium]